MAREFVVTIDGPAGSGKSTVAREIAKRISASFLDTGAMYRAVTLAAIKKGIDLSNDDELSRIFDVTDFQFKVEDDLTRVWIDNNEVTEAIRDAEIVSAVGAIADCQKIRARLVKMQRDLACRQGRIVTEGRDQGTVAFCDADFKFYLDATVDQRAKRRFIELKAKGRDVDLETIKAGIKLRDKRDMARKIGTLRCADDAVVIDTTDLTIDQVVDEMVERIVANG